MAKNKQQQKPSFADFLKELSAKKDTKPAVGSREERKYFLIVTEGVRTEPIYFEMLAGELPKNLVETIEVNGAGANTLSVVKEAMKKRDKRLKNKELPPYDEVWAVYDKDDFPDKNYNDAISLATREGIFSAHSNESFELWYVLHFEYLQSALKRPDYIAKLTKHLKTNYQKNDKALAQRIHKEGSVDSAIKRAVKLEALHNGSTPCNSCPHTKVYILVERLLAYKENREPKY